jgi:Cof subfamily protein (haloacid dehalogenase superfamily)
MAFPSSFTVRRRIGILIGSAHHNSKSEHNEHSSNGESNHHDGSSSKGLDVNVNAPFPSNDVSKPNKGDLYSNEDLANLLNLHESLQNEIGGFPEPLPPIENDGPLPSGLHDMVLQALEDIEAEAEASDTQDADVGPPPRSYHGVLEDEDVRKTLIGIRAIATDVDGTLTSSLDQTVHPRTQEALVQAVAAAQSPVRSLQHIFPATGKTRPGALGSLGPELSELFSRLPGVFCQGLYCVNAKGEVIFEQKLSRPQADAVIEFAHAEGLSIFSYDGDTIMTTRQSNPKHIREVSQVWGEPEPVLLESLLGYEDCFHKCIVWSDDTEEMAQTIRPKLQALAETQGGSVTQAIPTMLEFLPAGASKALGVQKLCEHLGIHAETELLAIGDAENDLGFLKMAAYGVAVGNAAPKVKEIADLIMEETSDEGGAGLAIDLFGLGDIFKSNQH